MLGPDHSTVFIQHDSAILIENELFPDIAEWLSRSSKDNGAILVSCILDLFFDTESIVVRHQLPVLVSQDRNDENRLPVLDYFAIPIHEFSFVVEMESIKNLDRILEFVTYECAVLVGEIIYEFGLGFVDQGFAVFVGQRLIIEDHYIG